MSFKSHSARNEIAARRIDHPGFHRIDRCANGAAGGIRSIVNAPKEPGAAPRHPT